MISVANYRNIQFSSVMTSTGSFFFIIKLMTLCQKALRREYRVISTELHNTRAYVSRSVGSKRHGIRYSKIKSLMHFLRFAVKEIPRNIKRSSVVETKFKLRTVIKLKLFPLDRIVY